MWKLIFGSVQGTSHVHSGLPCQDYCAGAVSGSTLVAACADGAGSAELSELGSRVAVDRFMEVACGDTMPSAEQVKSWVDAARNRLLEEAVANASTPRQLACTFLAALVGDGWAAFAQVGDGVIVFDGPSGYDLAFWPDNGEYANTTRFLSEENYREHLRIEIMERQISDVAVMTDGLQMLALDIAAAKAHDPFFAPLFHAVRYGPEEASLKSGLLAFMDSERVNDRTDDDKTLLLATRIISDVSQDLPDATA